MEFLNSVDLKDKKKILDTTANFENASVNLIPGYYKIALIHGEKTAGSTQELKFSTPSTSAGPTILTTVKPNDGNKVIFFVTENSFSILKRDSIGLSLDGNYCPSFQHSNYSNSAKVVANQSINDSVWTHVGIVVDYNSSRMRLYLNGVEAGEETLPAGEAIHFLATNPWLLGGPTQ